MYDEPNHLAHASRVGSVLCCARIVPRLVETSRGGGGSDLYYVARGLLHGWQRKEEWGGGESADVRLLLLASTSQYCGGA